MDSSNTKTWYVYLLCDPDTEEPFYVGKGTGERMYMHERTLKARYDTNTAKKAAIRKILAQGKQVLKKKVAEFDDEHEAYAYEVALIKQYGSLLTNIKPGGGRIYPAKPPKKPAAKRERKHQPPTYTMDDPYMPMPQVAKKLGWSREKLKQAIKRLDIKTHQFLSSPCKWIARDDILRLKEYKPRMGMPYKHSSHP